MCRRMTCGSCGRPDWRGCGAHVERVLGDVPVGERCRCREEGGGVTASAPPQLRGLLSRLTGR